MIFGGKRDVRLLRGISRELVNSIVEQEIGYYKVSLEDTESNIYGEAPDKIFKGPVKHNCLIVRGDQVFNTDDFGPDMTREVSFAFIREDLVLTQTKPEVGDIIQWHEDFYEVDTVRENELFLGKDNNYNLTERGEKFGSSISIIVDTHLTRGDKVGIQQMR